jgi:ATP-dependent DNA helicase RecG
VAVALFDDRLEIISSGELPFGLTPELLFQPHESMPWNPLMANVFYKRGFIETWGRGTLKMADLLREADLPSPVLREQNGFVTLTFALQSAGGSGKTLGKTPGKTPEAILAWLNQKPSATVPELAAQLGRSASAVERAMRKLREEGRLIRVGPDKGGRWQVVATKTKNIE